MKPNEGVGLVTAQQGSSLGLPRAVCACLFDMDGVLTKTAKLHAEAWKAAFDAFLRERAEATGAPFVPFDAKLDFERYVDGKLRADGVRSFLGARGVTLPEGTDDDGPEAATVRGVARRKNDVFDRLLGAGRVETFKGSARYVRAVRGAGLRTAVVSASKHCQAVLAAAGIADLFDARVDGVVAEREHLAGKPAPDTYLAAARALGAAPSQAAVFEDALSGVEAGRAGRFAYVVGVDRLGQADALRRRGADAVVTDLAALLGR